MKFYLILCALIGFSFNLQAQEQHQYGNFYDTTADIPSQINKAVSEAAKEHKNVILQVGGNWCIWCIRFHNFIEKDSALKSFMDAHYKYIPVNFDQHNARNSIWQSLGYPQRFGFPVFVILNEKGDAIHIQNSAYLEDADSYSKTKVLDFLKAWTTDAVAGKTL